LSLGRRRFIYDECGKNYYNRTATPQELIYVSREAGGAEKGKANEADAP
jgi:hypothetical protein